MKTKEFEKMIKRQSPVSIIIQYMKSYINLTDKQLEKVIEMKKGTEEEGRGGVRFGRTNNI